MICMLGPVGPPCLGLDEGQSCTVFTVEGIMRRTFLGSCVYKNSRSPAIGIYAVKSAKKRNPIKTSKDKA
jgi:hypothetical protein